MPLEITNLPLFVTIGSYALFFLFTTLFGIWVYLKSSKKTSHVMFLLLCLVVGIHQITYIFGTITEDTAASTMIFRMSAISVFIVSFTIHWMLSAIEREKEHKNLMTFTYVVSIALAFIYTILPETFLAASTSKMYFPNYYEAGSLLWIMLLFFAFGFLVITRILFKAYAVADTLHKNRIAYFIASLFIGYPLGALAFFLAYDINIDPLFAVPFNFFIAPLAYAILRYDIMDIKAAARKALAYTLFVIGTALFIVAANIGRDMLSAAYPGLPGWIIPLASALVIVLFAGFMWERVRDVESLKYEFITVVTHKFRTPLTRIKWAAELIRQHPDDEENEKMAVAEIENANENLVVLTDMLLNLRKANDSAFQYDFEVTDLCSMINQATRNVTKRMKDKDLRFTEVCPPNSIYANIDKRRMLFALQILLENAVTYTPKGGSIDVSIASVESDAYIKIKDSGIGISKEDRTRMFNKFWRSKEAKVADTEGMGIGLFMAKTIVERHEGGISAESDGVGKGTTFTVKLPLSHQE